MDADNLKRSATRDSRWMAAMAAVLFDFATHADYRAR